MATKTVAIDIGATMVRLAEVELSSGADPRDGATLHAYAERPTPAGVLRDGVIEEPAALGAVLKDLISAAKPSGKVLTVGLSHPSVVVREVDIPAQSMEKVRESLAFHVQDQLPMAPDEAALDFYPTAEYDAQAGPTLRGLLIAAPRELVRDIVAMTDAVNLTLGGIDHSALALWRSGCRGGLMQGAVALVDVGGAHTVVTVSQGGAPRLVRALPQSSGDATKAIANALKGAQADPEQLAREIGMDPNAQGNARVIADAAAHGLGPLLEAIRNTIVYVSSSNPGAGVERIVLTGGGSYIRGFGQALSSATRLPVVIGDPLAGLKVGKKVDVRQFQGREAELATVIGLGMGSL